MSSGQCNYDSFTSTKALQSENLWSCLAGLAAQARNLYAAEIAYGALDEGEKVQFLMEARQHPNKDVRNAMLLLLSGKVSPYMKIVAI